MDTSRYRAFLKVADCGSMKEAAERLGYTPSAVSQLIKALEDQLQIQLLQRHKEGVSLTDSGQKIYPIAQQLVDSEDHLLQTAADINGLATGSIRIGAYHSLAAIWLPTIIQGFQAIYPEIRIYVYEGTEKELTERIMDRRLDIAYFNNTMMKGTYDWFPMYRDKFVAVVPKDHPMAHAESFPLEKFAGERFIMPEHGYDYDVVKMLAEHGVVPDVYLSTFDSYILLGMVNQGLGVSIINELSYTTLSETFHNVRKLPLDPAQEVIMGLAVHDLQQSRPAVRKLVEYSIDTIQRLNKRHGVQTPCPLE